VLQCGKQEEDIPVLTGGKNDKIEFLDSNINDSLRVVYKVVINLDYPLKDTTKVINIESFDLISMSVINLTTKEFVINTSYDNNVGTDYQKYVWNLCYNKLKYWYMRQCYKNMIDRLQWDKRVVLGGTLYILPT
jgi:hypothetical protein